ncbi:MAG: hypothetical protein U5K37_11180 [Natrialbaceae archaeon]|nr:hypothetical protein [Natrialbaceae archaeon]
MASAKTAGTRSAGRRTRAEQVGVFGYSFGASIALLAVAQMDGEIPVVALAPTARLAEDLDVETSMSSLERVHLLVGEQDTSVDWRPVAEAARADGHAVTTVDSDAHLRGPGAINWRNIRDGV